MKEARPEDNSILLYKDGELPRESTYKDFLLVRQEGKRNVQRKKIASYKA